MDYKSAGVDTEKAQKLIFSLKNKITSTHQNLPLGKVGGKYGSFAGIFEPAASLNGFHLVAATDGVGTKIELCKKYNYLDGLGYDLAAMCINDLYCVGAMPLFFLDYISCGKLQTSWYNNFLTSLTKALAEVQVALLGGETAEHPGVMKEDEFDLAGFCVGMVAPQKKMPDIEAMQEGDVVIGFASQGLHSNGFSLLRRIFERIEQEGSEEQKQKIHNRDWVVKNVLAATKIYHELTPLWSGEEGTPQIKGLSHITGGGIYENLPRILPAHLDAELATENFAFSETGELEIFTFLKALTEQFVDLDKMALYRTFNMGIGMIAVASREQADAIVSRYKESRIIGKLVVGSQQVRLKSINI